MNYDYIVNLAGYVDHSNKAKTMKSHFNGCKNLAKFFLNRKIKKFIQIGSGLEYGKLKSPQIESKNNFQKNLFYLCSSKTFKHKIFIRFEEKKKFSSNNIKVVSSLWP